MNLEDQYRELAERIVNADTVNLIDGSVMTNSEIHSYIIGSNTGLYTGDIFSPVDFISLISNGSIVECVDARFISVLKYNVFNNAIAENVGDKNINTSIAVECDLWFRRLTDRIKELRVGKKPKTLWLN